MSVPRVLLLGSGKIGRMIADLLSTTGDYAVTVADRDEAQGVGVRFPADEKSMLLKHKIEEILGGHLASERPTQTI